MEGEVIGNIGHMFKSRIVEVAAGHISHDDISELSKVANKVNDRIKEILNNPQQGLRDIFKYKSQYVNDDDGSKICEGGPTAFFRYLFDFAIPSKVSIKTIY